jgi:phosphoribosylformimino-5-aminoimidazole carboxamide ribotide isomerase
VVNLDGAFDESQTANRAALEAILRTAGTYGALVQFGGGLRTLDGVAQALDLGVGRAILGTLAVEQPDMLAQMVARWGKDRVGASLDARAGLVQVRGWKEGTNVLASDAAVELKRSGLEWLVFTDIARDGLQGGINLEATVELAHASGMKVIASGGVRGREDVRAARQAGLAGIIAGRALYEGTLGIGELLQDEG